MFTLISPAKKLNTEEDFTIKNNSEPVFLNQSNILISELKKYSVEDIEKLMKLSTALSQLNVKRYHNFKTPFTPKNSKPAILSFDGAVYNGIDAKSFSEDDFKYAQNHLGILSGLYGLLKPLDLMQPYRLEMGTKLQVNSFKNLYQFWGDAIVDEINKKGEETIVNLASNEYFKAFNHKKFSGTIITPIFKDFKNGDYKTIMTYAKLARGYMTRYIIKNKLTSVEELKGFNTEGYTFNDQLSKNNELVFTRG